MKIFKLFVISVTCLFFGLMLTACDKNPAREIFFNVEVLAHSEVVGIERFVVTQGEDIITGTKKIKSGTSLTIEWEAADYYEAILTINGNEEFGSNSSPLTYVVSFDTKFEIRIVENANQIVTINNFTNGKADFEVSYLGQTMTGTSFKAYSGTDVIITAAAKSSDSRVVSYGIWATDGEWVYSPLFNNIERIRVNSEDIEVSFYIEHMVYVNKNTNSYAPLYDSIKIENNGEAMQYNNMWVRDGNALKITTDPNFAFTVNDTRLTNDNGVFETVITESGTYNINAVRHEIEISRNYGSIVKVQSIGLDTTLSRGTNSYNYHANIFDSKKIVFTILNIAEFENVIISNALEISPGVFEAIVTDSTEFEIITTDKLRHRVFITHEVQDLVLQIFSTNEYEDDWLSPLSPGMMTYRDVHEGLSFKFAVIHSSSYEIVVTGATETESGIYEVGIWEQHTINIKELDPNPRKIVSINVDEYTEDGIFRWGNFGSFRPLQIEFVNGEKVYPLGTYSFYAYIDDVVTISIKDIEEGYNYTLTVYYADAIETEPDVYQLVVPEEDLGIYLLLEVFPPNHGNNI